MKKTLRFFSMAALVLMGVMMTGCTSNELENVQPVINDNMVTLTTTVSLDNGATKALTATGVKTFAAGEKMAVIYKNTSGATVKAVSEELKDNGDITNSGKSAEFTFELNDPDRTKDVTYIYPAAMAKADGTPNYDALYTDQDGTLATLGSTFDYCTKSGSWNAGNLPMLTLLNQLAICAFTLKDALGANDKTRNITNLTVNDGTNTYTVTRTAADGPIYVAILPTSSATINYFATDGTTSYAKYVENKTYAAGNGYNISLKMAEVISGKFSVSSSKQVYFSKGNLRATTSNGGSSWTWSFATNQWDKIGNASANTSITGTSSPTVSTNGTVDLFGWSTSKTYLGISNYSDNSNYEGSFVDWGSHSDVKNDIGAGWRTLTSDEWRYLFVTRSTTSGYHYCKAKVNNVNGVILLPDDWSTSYYTLKKCDVVELNLDDNLPDQISLEDWNSSFVPHGAVFLPTTGQRRVDSQPVDAPDGRLYYWSSTKGDKTGADANANRVYIDGKGVNPDAGGGMKWGYAVRLIYPVK